MHGFSLSTKGVVSANHPRIVVRFFTMGNEGYLAVREMADARPNPLLGLELLWLSISI